ncbi:type II secretion system F family protein [Pseudidiomarina marina]|uniref:Type II secretion system protein GspF domain-containing protein n=1 Tax=Pseudidiomarina marina TaxID=502366 RepID=A0A432YAK0_9GAMM|nr:type II secretion system F family protein [Pseudidiomarina marina]RUO57984.1 hypothetical protein CWI76_11380 [Pseudidiomarina marina]
MALTDMGLTIGALVIVALACVYLTSVVLVITMISRWKNPAQKWLKDSTEQSLADFLIYLPAKIFWERLALLVLPLLMIIGLISSALISFLVGCGMAVAAIVTKNYLLARRHRLITVQLPDAIDLLVTAMQAGLSFNAAFERSGLQVAAPLRYEWLLVIRRMRTGETPIVALKSFYLRVNTEAVLQMLLTMQLGIQHGSQQADILQRLAVTLRQQQYAIERVKSLSAQARLQGKVMMLLPLGLFTALHFLHPENTVMLTQTEPGHYLLAASAGLMMLGHFLIRKILGDAYAN